MGKKTCQRFLIGLDVSQPHENPWYDKVIE
jgi:hypothetical protein